MTAIYHWRCNVCWS